MHANGRSALLIFVPVLIAVAGATACGDDDDESSSTAPDTTEPAETAASDSGDGATEVVAVDYRFEGLPERIDAGTTLTMRNDADHEVHELVAFTIPPEETRSVDELVMLPEGELFTVLPQEPALVLLAPPGEKATAVVGDGTLPAGRYLVACAIPTGADPDEFMQAVQEAAGGPPDVAGGPPHFTSGMYAEMVVE
jgi:hypothetical protein